MANATPLKSSAIQPQRGTSKPATRNETAKTTRRALERARHVDGLVSTRGSSTRGESAPAGLALTFERAGSHVHPSASEIVRRCPRALRRPSIGSSTSWATGAARRWPASAGHQAGRARRGRGAQVAEEVEPARGPGLEPRGDHLHGRDLQGQGQAHVRQRRVARGSRRALQRQPGREVRRVIDLHEGDDLDRRPSRRSCVPRRKPTPPSASTDAASARFGTRRPPFSGFAKALRQTRTGDPFLTSDGRHETRARRPRPW